MLYCVSLKITHPPTLHPVRCGWLSLFEVQRRLAQQQAREATQLSLRSYMTRDELEREKVGERRRKEKRARRREKAEAVDPAVLAAAQALAASIAHADSALGASSRALADLSSGSGGGSGGNDAETIHRGGSDGHQHHHTAEAAAAVAARAATEREAEHAIEQATRASLDQARASLDQAAADDPAAEPDPNDEALSETERAAVAKRARRRVKAERLAAKTTMQAQLDVEVAKVAIDAAGGPRVAKVDVRLLGSRFPRFWSACALPIDESALEDDGFATVSGSGASVMSSASPSLAPSPGGAAGNRRATGGGATALPFEMKRRARPPAWLLGMVEEAYDAVEVWHRAGLYLARQRVVAPSRLRAARSFISLGTRGFVQLLVIAAAAVMLECPRRFVV